MKVIGLCGGSGSGKGIVSSIFHEHGIPSIDTDLVYKEITSYKSECINELIENFGCSVCNQDGSLNREKMRELVFFDEKKEKNLKLLNSITHKFVLRELRHRINEYEKDGKLAVIADVPLLFESQFDKECDITIAVIADKSIRINRIIERDGLSYEHAKKRIESQIPSCELIKKVDFVIHNNDSIDNLKEKIHELYKQIIEK